MINNEQQIQVWLKEAKYGYPRAAQKVELLKQVQWQPDMYRVKFEDGSYGIAPITMIKKETIQ